MSNKLVPKLRFPEFKDSGEWEGNKLVDNIIKVGSGITPKGGEKNYKKTGRFFIRSQNVGWGELLLDDVAFINDSTHATFSSTEIQTNDVLLNITGASIGRSAIADDIICGGNVNQHVCIIRTKKDILNPVFLNQYLLSEYGQSQIDSFQAGGNRQGLNFSQIRSFEIHLPPLSEQQKIADCLSSLDKLITAQTEKTKALKQHKQALMQNLFPKAGKTIPKWRFPEFKDCGGEWEEKKLGEICEIGSSKRVHASDWKTEGIPFYRARDLVAFQKKGNIDRLYISTKLYEKNITISGEIKEGHLLVTGVGTIGVSYLVKKNDKFYFKDGNIIWLKNENKKVLSGFLSLLFHHEDMQKQIKTMASVGTVATYTISNANQTSISFPTHPEQQKIADCLSSLDKLITAQTEKTEALKQHKKGLMQSLFVSGEGDK